VDELARSDRAPVELGALVGLPSNLLAHHLEVLDSAGLIQRRRSSGDARRRYITLCRDALVDLGPASAAAEEALFICTLNSARSQLAAALWLQMTGREAFSAGTRPARRIHPGARAAARRAHVRLLADRPRLLDDMPNPPPLVVTVCDQAYEEVGSDQATWHWSIPDPVIEGTDAAFDATVVELRERINAIVSAAAS